MIKKLLALSLRRLFPAGSRRILEERLKVIFDSLKLGLGHLIYKVSSNHFVLRPIIYTSFTVVGLCFVAKIFYSFIILIANIIADL